MRAIQLLPRQWSGIISHCYLLTRRSGPRCTNTHMALESWVFPIDQNWQPEALDYTAKPEDLGN